MDYYVSEIKARLTIPQVLSRYGFETKGKNRIPCPFHNGQDNNFGFKDSFYHCFVCGARGDVISFVKDYFSLSFQDTIKKINDDFGLGLPIGEKMTRQKQLEIERRNYLARKEAEKKKKEHEDLRNAYFDAYGECVRLDRQIREHRPKSMNEEYDPLFAEGIKNIGLAIYKRDCAEEALYEYEHRIS